MDEELRGLTLERASYDEIAAAAARGGMKTLWDDGLDKAMAGLTSVEELRRTLTDVT
jgi:type II secretory ATPase GspE/PulE/Tfp pilus assembly ATPase PilB-like protein